MADLAFLRLRGAFRELERLIEQRRSIADQVRIIKAIFPGTSTTTIEAARQRVLRGRAFARALAGRNPAQAVPLGDLPGTKGVQNAVGYRVTFTYTDIGTNQARSFNEYVYSTRALSANEVLGKARQQVADKLAGDTPTGGGGDISGVNIGPGEITFVERRGG